MPDKPRMHAFIDESVATVEKGRNRSFYILSVAYVSPDDFAETREVLLKTASSDFMHATELLKSYVGREELLRLCSSVPVSARIQIFFMEPLISGDREGEATRIALFEAFLDYVEQARDMIVEEAVYETRRDGYMRQADNRTMRRLSSQHPTVHLRPQTPGAEKLLWIADLAAAAYRQRILRGNNAYLEAFPTEPQIVFA